jgi:quercetin dioxygenase-like cupin family protein
MKFAKKTCMQKRVFENPSIKDKVTIIESAAETGGTHLLVEVELAAGGGNSMHYHTSFTETFIPVDGILGIDLEKKKLRLQPGDTAVAEKMQVHRFYNPGNKPIRFRVKIAPASNGFLEAMAMGYGLAGDGLCNKGGVPKKLDHMAVLLKHSDTRLTGIFKVVESFLLWRAARAEKRGVKEQLMQQYCR